MTGDILIWIGGIVFVAMVGVIAKWIWGKISDAASKKAVDDLSDRVSKAATKAEVDEVDKKMEARFDKFQDSFSSKFDRFVEDIKVITRTGIDSGVEARKEQWKEIRTLGERIASMEGLMRSKNQE